MFQDKLQSLRSEGQARDQSGVREGDRALRQLRDTQAKRCRVGRWLLVVAGVLAVVVGAIGVFVPLLPTTPFLLLAATCFVRSSDRLYTWLIHHRWFGSYIRNYREHRAITLRAKIVTLTLLWGVIGYSAVFVARAWWLRALLGVVAVGVTIHLLLLKTLTRDMVMKPQGFPGIHDPGFRDG